jgi:hypothetical protein
MRRNRNARVFLIFALPLLIARAALPQALPYITDVVGEEGMESRSDDRPEPGDGDLRLIGTFKLFNPDTVPFYLWVSFQNGAVFKHSAQGDRVPAVRLVDMELRYRDASYRPMVKEFPKDGLSPRVTRRMGWGFSGSEGRFGKKKTGETRAEDEAFSETGVRRGRGGAVEIAFWKEEAQARYEMELWGVLYAPDVKAAVHAGNYLENIKFEIEGMPLTLNKKRGLRR